MGGDPHLSAQRRQGRRALDGAGPTRHAPAAGLHTQAGDRCRALTRVGLSKSLATAGLLLFVPAARWLGVGAAANICSGASIELAAPANEPEPNRLDHTRFDQATLLEFAT